MTSLRSRQKTDRTNRILTAAAELFRAHGYDAVKMETIAEKAELSIGTIYNYYQNKGDLLLAIVTMEVHEVLTQGAGIVNNPPLHVGDALDTLTGVYIDNALVLLDKEIWRLAMSISIQQPLSPLGLTYIELDNALMEQTCALVLKLQSLGLVHAHVDATGAGELIFNNANNMFINYVKNDTMKLLDLRSMIRRQSRLVIDAMSVEKPTK
jgi:AcrR family transcriptional regulator